MTREAIDFLRKSEGNVIQLICTDGEVLVAKILDVSLEHGDVVYDLVKTNMPERYPKHDVQPAFSTPFDQIVSAEPWLGGDHG
jgi:hypothetical protein